MLFFSVIDQLLYTKPLEGNCYTKLQDLYLAHNNDL